jgi:hypothetical protein
VNPQLRASDADRESAATRLQTACVEGRIDSEELERRLSATYKAVTVSELDRLTLDLLPPPPPAPVAPPAPVYQPYGGYPPPMHYQPPAPPTNGLAIASLVAGILWLSWVGSAAAVVFGHVALKQIKESSGRQGGYGLAVAGLVLGYMGMASLVLFLLAIAG